MTYISKEHIHKLLEPIEEEELALNSKENLDDGKADCYGYSSYILICITIILLIGLIFYILAYCKVL
jgi:hypothetical protein